MAQDRGGLIESAYAAFNDRDRARLLGFLAEGFVADFSRSPGPEAGVYKGAAGMGQLVDSYWSAMEVFELTLLDVKDLGEKGVVVETSGRGVGRLSGAEVTAKAAHHLLASDGKIQRWTVYQSLADALREAGAEPR